MDSRASNLLRSTSEAESSKALNNIGSDVGKVPVVATSTEVGEYKKGSIGSN